LQRPLVIYHGGCPDGFAAAYAISFRFRRGDDYGCDLVAGVYSQDPPDVTGRDVYIVDFSYRRPVLEAMCRQARSVTIIDHHTSAEQDLKGLEHEHDNLKVIFDMDKSGGILTWERYHQGPPPRLLLHIQDRDLWRFQLEGTTEIYAALMSRPMEFSLWERLCADERELEPLLQEGRAINRYRRRMIELHLERAVMTTIAGYRVPVVNCYEDIMSDLVGELSHGHPFAAGYQDQGALRKWSLRSNASGLDVAAIASRFGGGGHLHAAGFTTRLPEGLLCIPEAECS
jgi:oligoribonuclease NrnB/cAMP/cGMP phosphodiesterase (DHH superfamily)